jgi:antitoxin HicB
MVTRHDTVFNVQLTPDIEGGFVVTSPDLPEVVTQGDTRQEALDNAADALAEAVAGRMRRGDDIPGSGAAEGGSLETVTLPESIGPKLVLYLAMREAGIGKLELARRVGRDEKQIRRLLDPAHATNIKTIGEALRAMGKRLNLGFDQAA